MKSILLRVTAAVAVLTLFGLLALLLAALWTGHPFGHGLHLTVNGLDWDAGVFDPDRYGGTEWLGVVATLMLVTGVVLVVVPVVLALTLLAVGLALALVLGLALLAVAAVVTLVLSPLLLLGALLWWALRPSSSTTVSS